MTNRSTFSGFGLALSTLLALGSATTTAQSQEPLRAALFLNGTLGDKSFFDSAARGMEKAIAELGIEGRIVEGGYDPTRWENGLADIADSGDYDVIVTQTYDMTGPVQELSQDYPEIDFIILDSAVDYEACTCENVYSAVFRQNEGSYLAGVLAARMIEDGIDGIAPDAALGTVGGMAIPVIDDFITGFEAGAQSVLPDITLLRQYTNSFSDPATGKEIAQAEFNQGAAVVFQIAGASGLGVIEAAGEAEAYVIGVDSDQALIYADSNPDLAARIVTSMMKNVDTVVFRSLEQRVAGTLPLGESEALGLSEGGVGLAINDFTRAVVPAAILEEIETVRDGIIAGDITVPSAL